MKHTEFANAMLELEKAINKAEKIALNEFLRTLNEQESKELNEEWYRAMKATRAMTEIKCTISVQW